ncbi:MAG: TlpA family protein disulfide reductase [Bacteroidales bacterium]|nr:TlpA family protein disulfide reductase [Bacteroidales bacterium]
MSKKILLVVILLIFVLSSFSQTTIIRGTVENNDFNKIRILTYADQISYFEKTIASSEIDEKGNFFIEFDLSQNIHSFLVIGFQKAEFYIEPAQTYDLEIIVKKDDKPFSFSDPKMLDIKIINSKKSELNTLIRNFNFIYNNFIINNFNNLYKKRQKFLIDTLKNRTNNLLNASENKYFENYVKYKIASIEQMAGIKNKTNIAQEYFINKKVLYNNIEYMSFFNTSFDRYLNINSNNISINHIRNIINNEHNNASVLELIKIIKKDKLLSQDYQILELVLLKSLTELYYTPNYNKENILKIISEISENGKFSQNREIAKNLILSINKLKPGTAAPNFSLPDFNNNIISLKDFKGKYVYINFWNSNCIRCILEMDSIQKIKNQYKNKIDFISISTDRHPEKAKNILTEKNYDWIFLHFNNNIELLENYNVKMLPVNVLINPEANIISCPAVAPGWKLSKVKLY